VPGSSPLFQQGGNPPSRRHAFLHTRLDDDVKQIVTAGKGGKAQKRKPAKAVKRERGDAQRRFTIITAVRMALSHLGGYTQKRKSGKPPRQFHSNALKRSITSPPSRFRANVAKRQHAEAGRQDCGKAATQLTAEPPFHQSVPPPTQSVNLLSGWLFRRLSRGKFPDLHRAILPKRSLGKMPAPTFSHFTHATFWMSFSEDDCSSFRSSCSRTMESSSVKCT